MPSERKPVKVIFLGRWSVAIFLDENRYTVNLRRNMSQDEIDSAKNRPESLLLFEEETLIISELTKLTYQWIVNQKMQS